MSISDARKIGTMAKLANALALGASGAILLGSSPSCPTIRKNSGMIRYLNRSMSVFFGMLRCVACCVNKLINNKGKEKLARNRNSSSRTILRN